MHLTQFAKNTMTSFAPIKWRTYTWGSFQSGIIVYRIKWRVGDKKWICLGPSSEKAHTGITMISLCQNFARVVRACLAMRCASPAWQEEHDRRSIVRVRMLCFSRGTARLLKDQMTRATSLMSKRGASDRGSRMIQGKAICRWSWRKQARQALTRGRLQEMRILHGASTRPRSSIFTGLSQRRRPQFRRALGRSGLSLADEQSRNVRSVSSQMKHETQGEAPEVPPFH